MTLVTSFFATDSLRRLPIYLMTLAMALAVGCGESAGSGDPGVTSSSGADGGGQTADTSIGEDDTGASSGGSEDSGAASGGAVDAGAADTGEEDAGAEDTGAEDSGGTTCPGDKYCECKQNSDCDSGYCVPGPSGKLCAELCVDSCSKDGYVCVPITFPGSSDPVNVCVLEGGNVCNPCNSNSDCTTLAYAGAKCVDNGDAGSFCGQGCKTDNSCPVGYACKDVKDVEGSDSKQCVPKNAGLCSCSEAAISAKLGTKCFVKTGSAKCEGVRKCLPDGEQGAPPGGGLSACLADKADVEKCDGKDNDCDGDTDEEACDDKNPCTADSCDAKNAQCKHVNQDGPCDADDSVCTKNDVCSNGVCKAGEAEKCDDNNDCTADSCDPKKGCMNKPKEGDACNADDNPCTQNDSCDKDGTCKPGKAKACANDNPCVAGACKVTTGKCAYTKQDGVSCEDGNACTLKDTCKDEICSGVANKCDDGNACTDDSCDKKDGCKHKAQTGQCNDDNQCTVKDTCVGTKCVGSGAKNCDDGKDCTDDSCDPKKGCVNKPATNKPCDDGNGCTKNDFCKEGKCESGKNECTCVTDADCAKQEDGNKCNGTLYCDKSTSTFECRVIKKSVVVCDTSKDGQCAKTTCIPKTGKCLKETANFNGKDCNDNNLCTIKDACKEGACVADKKKCDDNNPCTDDGCDPKTGCTKPPNSNACNADDDACTVGDKCAGGVCDAGAKKSCDDKNQCTKDSCDAKTGKCKYVNLTTKCDDGNPCTVGDQCGTKDQKWQCVSGKGPDCDDKNPCTKDTCDPKDKGCKSVIDTSLQVPCYTADPKTKDVGLCKAGYRTCDKEGKTSAKCFAEVVPATKEACEGKDDDCDGTTDEGCKPTGYTARFGSALVNGKGKTYAARVLVGGSNVGGTSKGQKQTARLGFYEWVASMLGGKK